MDEKNEKLQPREVVDWYVPRQGSEVVDCYVHDAPLPDCARPVPPQPERKKSKKGLYIFLGLAAVFAVVVVLAVVLGSASAPTPPPTEEGDASSIVDISVPESTTIPRDPHRSDTRMTISDSPDDVLTAQEVYAKVNPATVLVVAGHGQQGSSLGTGVVMTPDGYIITNAHVIAGGDSCWIALYSGVTYDAKLVGYDTDNDIAVLRAVDAADLPTAEFGDSELVQVGDDVYAIGNPLGVELRGTFTEGIVSAINRDVMVGDKTVSVMQTTAPLNNGNSGGPLINRFGQVIGINTLKMSGTGGADEAVVEGLGFALPVSGVYFVVNDIIATGLYHGAPTLGITVAVAETADGDAVCVLEVNEGSGAAEAGVEVGDLILQADGQEIHTTAELLALRRGHVVGETMHLTLLRDGDMVIEAEVMLYAAGK